MTPTSPADIKPMSARADSNSAAMATPSSPLSPLQFGRGGLVKKRFRRSNLGNMRTSKENAVNAPQCDGDAAAPKTTKHDSSAIVAPSTIDTAITTPAAIDQWWADKRDHFRHWLRCNPLRLGIGADSVRFIKDQLNRGDQNPSRQATCWRHVVVELLSTGVPGLDPELLSVAEIPDKADGLDMAAVLNTVPSLVDGSKGPPLEAQLAGASPESLRREVVRLATERTLILENIAVKDSEAEEAVASAAIAESDRDAAVSELAAARDSLSLKESRISELEARLATPSVSGAAGSGVAAVKALQRPSSAEGINDKSATVEASVSVDIRSMSMLDRQEHFLKQRNIKRAETLRLRKEKEEEEERRMRDEKAAASKLRTSKFDHVRSRVHETAKKGGKKQSEVGGGGGGGGGSKKSKWGKLRTTVRATAALKAGSKRRGKKKRGSTSSSSSAKNQKPTLLEMCKSMLNDHQPAAKSTSSANSTATSTVSESVDNPAPPSTPLAPRTPCQSPMHAAHSLSHGNRADKKISGAIVSADDATTTTPVQEEESLLVGKSGINASVAAPPDSVSPPSETAVPSAETDADAAGVSASLDEVNATDSPPVSLMAVPTKANAEGFFAKFGTTDRKGKHVIQDAMPFNIDTFFRKRDKNAGADGVSLLMARREDDHGTLEAIAVFFDRTKFTEQQAADWWRDNRIRFPNRID